MARRAEYEEWGGGDGARVATDAADGGEVVDNGAYEEENDAMGYYDEEEEGGRLGTFFMGLFIGLALGSAVALLMAPQTGEATRKMLGKRARTLGDDVSDRWEDLRDELDWLARRGRKRVRRGIERGRWGATRGRWKAEDLVERGKRMTR